MLLALLDDCCDCNLKSRNAGHHFLVELDLPIRGVQLDDLPLLYSVRRRHTPIRHNVMRRARVQQPFSDIIDLMSNMAYYI